MTDKPKQDQTPPKPEDMQGEGNYDAARQFDAEQTEFAENPDKVEQKAREAADALDGPEGEELRDAEAKARRKPDPSST